MAQSFRIGRAAGDLGCFLLGAADAELESASAREALAGLRVSDLMVRAPAVV